MYQEHILEHYGSPYHRGACLEPTHVGHAVSDVCGDEVHLELRCAEHRVVDIWWTGEGCCFSQGAASMLVQHFQGRTLEDVEAFNEGDMIQLFGVEDLGQRRSCVLTAFTALKNLEKPG
jgi:nitrogen fixation NifU-like protein